MVLERLVEPLLRKSPVKTLMVLDAPASAVQPEGTRSNETLCAATAETRQKPLSATVPENEQPALSPSPTLTHSPATMPSVVKSSVVEVRPLPPEVTAAMSPLTPWKPTWRTLAPTGMTASAEKVAAG